MILDDISIVEHNNVQPESYCTPTGNLDCSLNDFIKDVTFNTISNINTGCSIEATRTTLQQDHKPPP